MDQTHRLRIAKDPEEKKTKGESCETRKNEEEGGKNTALFASREGKEPKKKKQKRDPPKRVKRNGKPAQTV